METASNEAEAEGAVPDECQRSFPKKDCRTAHGSIRRRRWYICPSSSCMNARSLLNIFQDSNKAITTSSVNWLTNRPIIVQNFRFIIWTQVFVDAKSKLNKLSSDNVQYIRVWNTQNWRGLDVSTQLTSSCEHADVFWWTSYTVIMMTYRPLTTNFSMIIFISTHQMATSECVTQPCRPSGRQNAHSLQINLLVTERRVRRIRATWVLNNRRNGSTVFSAPSICRQFTVIYRRLLEFYVRTDLIIISHLTSKYF